MMVQDEINYDYCGLLDLVGAIFLQIENDIFLCQEFIAILDRGNLTRQEQNRIAKFLGREKLPRDMAPVRCQIEIELARLYYFYKTDRCRLFVQAAGGDYNAFLEKKGLRGRGDSGDGIGA